MNRASAEQVLDGPPGVCGLGAICLHGICNDFRTPGRVRAWGLHILSSLKEWGAAESCGSARDLGVREGDECANGYVVAHSSLPNRPPVTADR